MGSRKQLYSRHLTFLNKLSQGYMSAPEQHQGCLAKDPFQHFLPNQKCLYRIAAFCATRKIGRDAPRKKERPLMPKVDIFIFSIRSAQEKKSSLKNSSQTLCQFQR